MDVGGVGGCKPVLIGAILYLLNQSVSFGIFHTSALQGIFNHVFYPDE